MIILYILGVIVGLVLFIKGYDYVGTRLNWKSCQPMSEQELKEVREKEERERDAWMRDYP